MKKIEEDIKNDELHWRNKPRLALFSYTASHSPDLRERSASASRRDAKGNVKLEPRGIITRRTDTFSKVGFLAETTKFVDSYKIKTWRPEDTKTISKMHKTQFRISKVGKKIGSVFEHIPDPPRKEPVVGFGKPGLYARGPKSGLGLTTYGHLFSKPFEYISDPYDRKRELESKDREKHRSKIVGKRMFTSSSHSREHFEPHKELYGKDGINIKTDETPTMKTSPTPKIHNKAFVPSSPAKIGFNRTFNKYPEYLSDPLPVVTKQDRKKELVWKYNYYDLTSPTPSVKKYNERYRPTGHI